MVRADATGRREDEGGDPGATSVASAHCNERAESPGTSEEHGNLRWVWVVGRQSGDASVGRRRTGIPPDGGASVI